MSREVYFSDKVNSKSISQIREKIDSLYEKNKTQEIVLYISSGGGSGVAAISFFEWIRIKKIPLVTVAVAEVSSAAITLFLAGTLRKATTKSWFLIHPGGTIRGDLTLMLGKIISLRRSKEDEVWKEHYESIVINLIKERTNIPADLAKRIMTKSFLLLNPLEGKKLGLVHEII